MKPYGIRFWSAGVTACLILLAVMTAPAEAARRVPEAASPRTPRMAPADPRFVVWQAIRGLEPILESVSPNGLGERPGPQPVLGSRATPWIPERLTYAASFDLRSQGRLTSVKNQGSWGTCWSFATYGSLESSLLPGESLDFSEDNLVLNSGFDTGSTASDKYNSGGNLQMSTAYLARWAGPVLESEDAYGDGTTPAGLSARKHVQDVSWYAPRGSASDNDQIKYALTSTGAVYVSMSWQGATSSSSAYYNAATHAYYYDGAAGTNHGVLIVGWNDDYAASNFSTTPPGPGAFIVRNSWGSGWGESGFFYVSYYDTKLGRTGNTATFEGAQATTNYGSIYQHDPLGYTAAIGYGSTTAWGASRFTATADSTLNAVGFYALAAGTAYEVWEGPSTASLTKVAEGSVPQMGFHTVTVPAGTDLTGGGAFVVAVKLTTPGYTSPLALEYPSAGYAPATAATGQSYMSSNGSSWSDVAAAYANTNVCLKAYASVAPASASGYGFAPDAVSAWKTSAQTVTITASGGDGTNRTIYYSQDGGSTWDSTAGDAANVSVTTQGSHHLKFYAKTSAATEPVHDAGWVNVDTVAPSTTDDHLTASLVAPATITLTPTDATSGMTGGSATTRYKVDGAASYTTGTSVALATPGSHTVAYHSTDKAGNAESPDRSFTVTVAAPAAPTSTTSYSFAGDATSGWKTTSQTVTITASGGSGTGRAIFCSQDGGATWSSAPGSSVTVPVSTQGPHHFEYYARDSLATETTHDAGWVNVDSVAPVTSDDHLSVSTTGPTTVTLAPADATSGMTGGSAGTEYRLDGAGAYEAGTSVGVPYGTHTVSYRSTDKAGNVETPEKTFTITVIDPLCPLSSCGYAFAADAASGWKKTAQTVTIAASGGTGEALAVYASTDGGASWTGSPADVSPVDVLVAGEGAHHFLYYAADSLLQEGPHDAGWVNIDTARPTTKATAAHVRKGRRVTLRFRVNDAPSGCGRAVVKLQIKRRARVVKTIRLGTRAANVALTYKYTARLAKGTYTYRVLATDAAGNAASKTVSARLVLR